MIYSVYTYNLHYETILQAASFINASKWSLVLLEFEFQLSYEHTKRQATSQASASR